MFNKEQLQELENDLLAEQTAPKIVDIFSKIEDLVRGVPYQICELEESKAVDSSKIPEAIKAGIKFVELRSSKAWVATSNDLGDRYSFASHNGDIFLHKNYALPSSEDGKRDQPERFFEGNSAQLALALKNEKKAKKIKDAVAEIVLATLAVFDQLAAEKTAASP